MSDTVGAFFVPSFGPVRLVGGEVELGISTVSFRLCERLASSFSEFLLISILAKLSLTPSKILEASLSCRKFSRSYSS